MQQLLALGADGLLKLTSNCLLLTKSKKLNWLLLACRHGVACRLAAACSQRVNDGGAMNGWWWWLGLNELNRGGESVG